MKVGRSWSWQSTEVAAVAADCCAIVECDDVGTGREVLCYSSVTV